MRTFSAAVQTILDSDLIRYAFLIKLEFNTTYYLTSHPYDLTYGGQVYLANGGLMEYDPPKFSSVVDREGYKIVVSEVLNLLKAEFEANVVGKGIEVKVALVDASGDPLLGASDIIDVYKGYVDRPSITNDFDNKLAIIEGTSPMADLDFINATITSKDGMDQLSATDTSYDEVFDNNQVTIRWGKV